MIDKFNSDFFILNRSKLMDSLPDSIVVVTANGLLQSSADCTFEFRQDSNFWYLTGVDEPDFVLIINTKIRKSQLLLPQQNDYKKEWGGRYDNEGICSRSGIKNIDSLARLPTILKRAKITGLSLGYLKPLQEVVDPFGFYANPARRLLESKLLNVYSEGFDIRSKIAKLRQIKQSVEIESIQKAIDITGETLNKVKKLIGNFKTEADLSRIISSGFYKYGGNGHGYAPIIASGKNAATIHYSRCNGNIVNNQLLLLDVGARFGYYTADISRTWAVGKVKARHKELFDATLKLQNIAFTMLKPGVYIKEYQKTMEEEAQKIMSQLGCNGADKPYPHSFSHFLGLDVHDAGDYTTPITENMVLTVEPGIYLPDEGIGIRIEDNILITKSGNKVLSKNISKTL